MSGYTKIASWEGETYTVISSLPADVDKDSSLLGFDTL
jgi:hypothetical protein